jgi:hypothetical protein
MSTTTPNGPARLTQRSQAQRRIRRTSARRLFCSTNGCTTFLVPDASGALARCPVCGYQRLLQAAHASDAGSLAH